MFVTFGCVGLVWVAVWLYWFRNDPSEHPAVSASELALIVTNRKRVTDHGGGWSYWRTLIRSRNMFSCSGRTSGRVSRRQFTRSREWWI